LHFVEFGTYLQCLPIHVENENVQFLFLFFFHFLFFFGKAMKKPTLQLKLLVLVIFVPKKVTFKNSRHHPSIHLFLKTNGWTGPRVHKDGFVMGTRHPLQAQNVHDMGQTCVLASSIHPSIHPSIHLFSEKRWMDWAKGRQGWVCNGH
jgi:hypothetical protein